MKYYLSSLFLLFLGCTHELPAPEESFNTFDIRPRMDAHLIPPDAAPDIGEPDIDEPDATISFDAHPEDSTPVDLGPESCTQDNWPINHPIILYPLDVLRLDATPFIQNTACYSSFEWVITHRPDGSTCQPVESFFDHLQPANGGSEDNPSTPTALFFVDIRGFYTIELWVSRGERRFVPVRIFLQAIPP